MPGSVGHLVARFFDYVTASAPSEVQRAEIASLLSPLEAELFYAQNHRDQAHGWHAAQLVMDVPGSTSIMARAALLHDIGKRHAGLGAIRRSIASILIRLGIRLHGRYAAYRDHGESGARELETAGSPPLVVDFARCHHGQRPDSIPQGVWDVLVRADAPAKPWLAGRDR